MPQELQLKLVSELQVLVPGMLKHASCWLIASRSDMTLPPCFDLRCIGILPAGESSSFNLSHVRAIESMERTAPFNRGYTIAPQ